MVRRRFVGRDAAVAATDVDDLRQRVTTLERLVDDLRRRRGPDAVADRDLRQAMADASRGEWFRVKDLLVRATVDARLAEALTCAFVDPTPSSVGCWLREHQGRTDDVWIERRGRRWRAHMAT